ncbi:hypothetical protein HDU67_001025 [Dinochytrium kinnereticum]|nr:hypothetical protein HDU67_001025 [Dinochytrium kinnereticum]
MPSSTNLTHVQVKVDRSLLNPMFDGYKLRTSTGVQNVSSRVLPTTAASSKITTIPGLPFKRVEFRAKYNHLFVDRFHDHRAFFIDDGYALMEVKMEGPSASIDVRKVFDVPVPSLASHDREYPSIETPCKDILIVSDGAGTTYFLRLADTSHATLMAFSRDQASSPSTLLTSRLDSTAPQSYSRFLLLRLWAEESNVQPTEGGATTSKVVAKKRVTFFTDLVRATLSPQEVMKPVTLEVITTVKTLSAPYFAVLEEDGSFVVCSQEPAESIDQPSQQPSNTATPSFLMEIHTPTPPPPLYKWTQSKTDLTVYFDLPTPTEKHRLNCTFHRDRITILIDSTPFFNHTLFDTLIPSECIWTLERTRLLTLHLQKTNEGTRWDHLPDQDDGVLETLDPSELAAFRESLEKYTSSSSSSEDSTTTLGKDVRAASEQVEDEDFEGANACLVRFSVEGAATHVCVAGSREWICAGFVGGELQRGGGLRSVCLKSDVDGVICEINPKLEVKHTCTLDAFNFVHASKREKRFVCFSRDHRYGVVVEARRQMYVYRRTRMRGESASEQFVVDLDVGLETVDAGDVVGVQQLLNGMWIVLRDKAIVAITTRE